MDEEDRAQRRALRDLGLLHFWGYLGDVAQECKRFISGQETPSPEDWAEIERLHNRLAEELIPLSPKPIHPRTPDPDMGAHRLALAEMRRGLHGRQPGWAVVDKGMPAMPDYPGTVRRTIEEARRYKAAAHRFTPEQQELYRDRARTALVAMQRVREMRDAGRPDWGHLRLPPPA